MAFTGAAVITMVTERKVRITGLSLAGAAIGTISLIGGTGAVKTPDAFNPQPYKVFGAVVQLQDSIEVTLRAVTAVTTSVPIQVVKTGTTAADFLITMTNSTVSTASPNLEIYIEFH